MAEDMVTVVVGEDVIVGVGGATARVGRGVLERCVCESEREE